METKNFYDEDYDSLIISQKVNNERVKTNFMFDDIIISLTGKGKIVAIEIRDASKYLQEMGFDAKILNNIADAKIIVIPRKDFIFIGFQILGKMPPTKQRIPVANIPLACLN